MLYPSIPGFDPRFLPEILIPPQKKLFLHEKNITLPIMKLRLLTFALLLCGTGALAQNPYIALQGVTDGPEGVTVADPRTVLSVDVSVECDLTLSGPYARYAQKYLGVRAPLTDKTTWSVKSASVALLLGNDYLQAEAPVAASQQVYAYATADTEFARLQPDKTSVLVPPLEDAARDAANTIFTLRRQRMELITGEAGENVFGEGLESALAEIARLEQSYLELFLGKRVVSTQSKRYVVYPQPDKKQYVVCRFSTVVGLLPESDLSGDMILLQIEPSDSVFTSVEAGMKETSVVKCRVANMTTCTVIADGREYARAMLPLFEFGRTVNVALPRRK